MTNAHDAVQSTCSRSMIITAATIRAAIVGHTPARMTLVRDITTSAGLVILEQRHYACRTKSCLAILQSRQLERLPA